MIRLNSNQENITSVCLLMMRVSSNSKYGKIWQVMNVWKLVFSNRTKAMHQIKIRTNAERPFWRYHLQCHRLWCHHLRWHLLWCYHLRCHHFRRHHLRCHHLTRHHHKLIAIQYTQEIFDLVENINLIWCHHLRFYHLRCNKYHCRHWPLLQAVIRTNDRHPHQ